MNEQNQNQETAAEETVLPEIPMPEFEEKEEEKAVETEESTEEKSEEEAVEEPDKPKKKVSGFTRRLNREREKTAALEEELRQERAKNAPKQQEQPKTGEPDPKDYEHGINDINYIREMAKHEGRQAFYEAKKQDTIEERKAKVYKTIAKAQKNYSDRLDEAASKYEDFEDVISSSDVDFKNPQTQHAIMSSPVAGELAYHLANNPEEARKIADADPVSAGRMLFKLEAKLTPAQKKDKNGVSKFTKPFKPVGTGKTKSRPEFNEEMSNEQFAERFPIDFH